jgi:predicted nicotinamide N-methyase
MTGNYAAPGVPDATDRSYHRRSTLARIDANPTEATARERRRLLRRINRRYQVVTETVSVGPLTFPFTRIANPDRVLDEVAAEEDRLEKVSGKRADGDYLHLPYWAELWDSAMGVAVAMADRAIDWNPQGALMDLGCGMGLSGTVAAALGAHVLFADIETPALLFARLNSLPYSGGVRWHMGIRCSQRVRTRRLDWRTDRLGEQFYTIVGADILYERKQWDHLEPFWREHLLRNGKVLLGEPGRPTGDLFPDWIRERGWSLTTVEQPVPTRPRPIRLFLLARP